MVRVLEMLAFWRRRDPNRRRVNLIPNPSDSDHRHLNTNDHSLSSSTTTLPGNHSATFLVPDLGDIRPFLDRSSGPVSMRELLSAISGSEIGSNNQKGHPATSHKDPLHVRLEENVSRNRGKRKLDESQEFSDSFIENQLDILSSQKDEHLGNFKAEQMVGRPATVQSFRSKRARILPIKELGPVNPSTKESDTERLNLIHGLPPEVWYKVFSYNGLAEILALVPWNRQQFRNWSLDQPSRSQVSLALRSQRERHDLIRLCKGLSELARKAACHTLVLGSARMVAQVTQKLEADSKLSWGVQSLILVLPPSTRPPTSQITPRSTPQRNRSTIPQSSTAISISHQSPSVRSLRSRAANPSIQINNETDPSSGLRRQVFLKKNMGRKGLPSATVASNLESPGARTIRNERLNPSSPDSAEEERESLEQEWEDEEAVCGTNLPSLLLSVGRTLKVCCLFGTERVVTRALRSLSVLSNFLSGLSELYVNGGGESMDLFTLIQGLTSLSNRPTGTLLRIISISGPLSTLFNARSPSASPEPNGHWSNRRVPSGTTTSSSIHLRSSSSSTATASSQKSLSVQHICLGDGIPLTAEELNWLITNTSSGKSPAIKTLQVCLKASPENHQSLLRASVRSNGSISSQATSRSSLSTNASLSRVFERIGSSLISLMISEDWNEPISMESQKRQKSGVKGGDGSEEKILDEALAFCSRLERLGLSDGQMYSSRLLSVLPFTLKEIEIWDGPRSGTGKVEGSGGFSAEDVVLARSEAALFGLERIYIRRKDSSSISGRW
ncbi:hypothetical protein PPACK8108_LOCUS22881 [Phakopsora pachyrhizi]|uniref:F-box domain-containing protein n=1 Tax=Phakopsora pachyrhizi TaxID=170000 RepID=A0AAV0BNR3_PHAPC|nr:hypothetical protein PPACK8108_LOCUS22881 [Phakopsora pachyrhizi]